MNDQFIEVYEKQAGVYEVVLNRPEIHNAFNDEMINELTKCFEKFNRDSNLRAVILTGKGKSFCAGADLNWMARMKDYSEKENFEDSQRLAKMLRTLDQLKVPLIGKVNGPALGGGAGLIATCDYVVSSETALFGFTEVRLGLVPAVISPFVTAKIGTSYTRAYFLTGERFNAAMAMRMQLVHKVSLLDNLDETVNEVVENILMGGPLAVGQAKKLTRGLLEESDLETYTCHMIAERRVSDEGQEGMSALLEKRKPSWIK